MGKLTIGDPGSRALQRARELKRIERDVTNCEKCPRLREHCRLVADKKRRAYSDWDYWGRPVPAFGDSNASVFVVGLAPAAHGANRTGRMFTGDRSGDFLYDVLHATGFASQPGAVAPGDGLVLRDIYITAAARCAPPANKPTPAEFATCREYLRREWDAMSQVRVVVVLGQLALGQLLYLGMDDGWVERRAEFRFGHGAEYPIKQLGRTLLCSYHPSQQNTQTGRLTRPMLIDVFERARELAGCDNTPRPTRAGRQI